MADVDTSGIEANSAPSGGAPSGEAAPAQFGLSDAALRSAYPKMFEGPEAPPASGGEGAAGGKGGEGQAAPAAPATVEVDGYRLPADLEINREAFDGFRQIVNTHGLSKEAGQAVLDLALKASAAATAGYEGAFKDMRSEWVQTLRQDPEFAGSRGERWDKSLALARKAVAAFGTPALREMFDTLGVGDHPELVKFMAKIGAALGDDFQPASAESQESEPDEEAIIHSRYPSMFQDE